MNPSRNAAVAFLTQLRHPPPAAWTDNRLAQSQHYLGAIYLALNAVVEAMASAAVWVEVRRQSKSLTFGGSGDDEDYTPLEADHPLSDIVRFPNPQETFGSLLGYMALQWGLTGNAPVWFVPGAHHSRPVELYALPEATLQPLLSYAADNPYGAWLVTPYYPTGWIWTYGSLSTMMARSVVIPGHELRKLKAPHPLIRNDGYSPLTACGLQFDLLEAIDRSRHAAMLQAAQLGTIVDIPGLSQEQLEHVAEQFRQRYSGPQNARQVAFLASPPGTEVKVQQVGEAPREMDYTSSWEQAARFVLATFGVPPAIAGLTPSTGYAEFYAAQVQFHYRVSLLTRRMADFFTRFLADPWSRYPGELRIKIELPKPRNQDEDKNRLIQLASQGAVTVNELRAVVDLEPLPGGDVPPSIYLTRLQQQATPAPTEEEPGELPADAPSDLPAEDTPLGGTVPYPESGAPQDSRPPLTKAQEGEEFTDAQGRRRRWERNRAGRLTPVVVSESSATTTARPAAQSTRGDSSAGSGSSSSARDTRSLESDQTASRPETSAGKKKKLRDALTAISRHVQEKLSLSRQAIQQIRHKAESRWQRLQEVLKQWRAGQALLHLKSLAVETFHALEHVALYAAKKTQVIAAGVGRERGWPPEKVEAFRQSLYWADFVGGYVTGGVALATLGPVAGKAAAVLPSASAVYLAYSTVRNPLAVWRAARRVLRQTVTENVEAASHIATGIARRLRGRKHEKAMAQRVWYEHLADLLDQHPDPDWVWALFLAATAHTQGDVPKALALVQKALSSQKKAKSPTPPSQSQHRVGEVWQGKDGKWYTLIQVGQHVVPVRAHAPDAHQDEKTDLSGWHATPGSSAISHVHYDAAKQRLTVKWRGRSDPRFIAYEGVSPEQVRRILSSPSVGRSINRQLRHDAHRRWTATDIDALTELALQHEDIRRIVTQARRQKAQQLSATLSQLIVPQEQWSADYAQLANAAILSVIPQEKDGRRKWNSDNVVAYEVMYAIAVDNGYIHHGGTHAIDVSSGQTLYETADGTKVVIGIDTKTSFGQSKVGEFDENRASLRQKCDFLAYRPNDPDDHYVTQGVARGVPRMVVYHAGVDVHGQEKDYGFAYYALLGGTTKYTKLHATEDITFTVPPNQEITLGKKTYHAGKKIQIPKGAEIPPDILAIAQPEQLRSWGFDPLQHAMPIKIHGLHSPEDLVKNPQLMRQSDARLQEYLRMVKYEDYAEKVGIKLEEHAEREMKQTADFVASVVRFRGGSTGKEHLDMVAYHAARADKAEQARQEAERRHQRHLELTKRAAQLGNPEVLMQLIGHMETGDYDAAEELLRQHEGSKQRPAPRKKR